MATTPTVLAPAPVPSVDAGAATPVTSSVPFRASFGADIGIEFTAYRRYSYSVNTSGSNFIYKRHEYAITAKLMPSGNVYTDAADIAETAADIISIFRLWLIAEIEEGQLETPVARQYVALYNATNPVTNPSFAVQFQALLSSCPTNESSYEVDQLRAECVAAFGWDANP